MSHSQCHSQMIRELGEAPPFPDVGLDFVHGAMDAGYVMEVGNNHGNPQKPWLEVPPKMWETNAGLLLA